MAQKDVFSPRTFCLQGRSVPQTFRLRTFCTLGRFVSGTFYFQTFSLRTFCLGTTKSAVAGRGDSIRLHRGGGQQRPVHGIGTRSLQLGGQQQPTVHLGWGKHQPVAEGPRRCLDCRLERDSIGLYNTSWGGGGQHQSVARRAMRLQLSKGQNLYRGQQQCVAGKRAVSAHG